MHGASAGTTHDDHVRHAVFYAAPACPNRLDTEKGDARKHLNRVLMPGHVATIKTYLEQNSGQYILPPLTPNAAADVEIFQIGNPIGGVTFGFIMFGSTTIFVPVDSQHRTAAIIGYEANGRHVDGVLDDMEGFGQDGASVQLTLEDNTDQLRQECVNLTMSGLVVLGTIGHYVTKGGMSSQGQVTAYEKVAKLNWRRDDPLWRATGFVKEVLNNDGTPQLTETGAPKLDVTRAGTDIEQTVARVMEVCDIR